MVVMVKKLFATLITARKDLSLCYSNEEWFVDVEASIKDSGPTLNVIVKPSLYKKKKIPPFPKEVQGIPVVIVVQTTHNSNQ